MSNEPRKSAFAGLKSGFSSEKPTTASARGNGVTSTQARPQQVAKRRDPNYQAVSTSIRKDIHRKVRVRLVEEDRDLADLLEELLTAWLHEKGVKV